MKREYKKDEILVSENLKVIKQSSTTGAETAFFEKKFKIEKTGEEYIKLYVYINFGSDKGTIVIKPACEKKIINAKTGDVSFIDERKLYKEAYEAYLDKKEELNSLISEKEDFNSSKKSSKKEKKSFEKKEEIKKINEETTEALAE